MRTTRRMVEAAFERWCNIFGHRIATTYNDVGAFRLDYCEYGGYVIEEIDNDRGAVSMPTGHLRRSGRELVEAIRFAIDSKHSAD